MFLLILNNLKQIVRSFAIAYINLEKAF